MRASTCTLCSRPMDDTNTAIEHALQDPRQRVAGKKWGRGLYRRDNKEWMDKWAAGGLGEGVFRGLLSPRCTRCSWPGRHRQCSVDAYRASINQRSKAANTQQQQQQPQPTSLRQSFLITAPSFPLHASLLARRGNCAVAVRDRTRRYRSACGAESGGVHRSRQTTIAAIVRSTLPDAPACRCFPRRCRNLGEIVFAGRRIRQDA